MFEITINRVFCAAHAIRLPDGSLESLHGHNWQVHATVAAKQLDDLDLVMDFHVLAGIVDQLLAGVDNRCLNEVPPFSEGRHSPTAERVAWWLGEQIIKQLPAAATLVDVTVSEAPGCTARYRP